MTCWCSYIYYDSVIFIIDIRDRLRHKTGCYVIACHEPVSQDQIMLDHRDMGSWGVTFGWIHHCCCVITIAPLWTSLRLKLSENQRQHNLSSEPLLPANFDVLLKHQRTINWWIFSNLNQAWVLLLFFSCLSSLQIISVWAVYLSDSTTYLNACYSPFLTACTHKVNVDFISRIKAEC